MKWFMKAKAVGLCLALGLVCAARAHEAFVVREVEVDAGFARIAATYVGPTYESDVPCVVIAGGTLSQTRDGGLVEGKAPARDALERLALALASEGYASVRFDRVGYGSSKPGAGWKGTYHDEARAVAAVIGFARQQGELGKIIVAGESAGAYMACLAAKDGVQADGYLFLGGFCGPVEEMYEYNFGRLAEYAGKSATNLAWAEKHARRDLALGRHYHEMLAAAAAGKGKFELVDGEVHTKLGLERRQEELKFPPDEMFRYIHAPALALAGQKDLNVPPSHAARAARIMAAAGNTNVTSLLISGADHSFQKTADSSEEAFRERYTFESFQRPYHQDAYTAMAAWLRKTAPSPVHAELLPRSIAAVSIPQRAFAGPELDPMTETTPERLQLAPGIELVADIADRSKTAGVETLEGRIGPLLLGEGCQAHFIEMPAGLYLAEHAHSSESVIYTVRGRWVLCSNGRRQLMKPGSLFRFGSNIATGYEVPFDEGAFLLIFKGERSTRVEKDFIDYLKGFAGWLKREQKSGVPFLLRDLPTSHPARVFAREVNAEFEKKLGKAAQAVEGPTR
jgi:pimeloyl-ACP methyl ester carboxylesterase/quercetin dioxygenase-like cupin family protein